MKFFAVIAVVKSSQVKFLKQTQHFYGFLFEQMKFCTNANFVLKQLKWHALQLALLSRTQYARSAVPLNVHKLSSVSQRHQHVYASSSTARTFIDQFSTSERLFE